jgi:hypothetical protein
MLISLHLLPSYINQPKALVIRKSYHMVLTTNLMSKMPKTLEERKRSKLEVKA